MLNLRICSSLRRRSGTATAVLWRMKSLTVASRRSERSTPKSLRERMPERASAVSRKVLLGIVPVLIPAPPTSRSFSTSATRLPKIPTVVAPLMPAGPPPITTTSKSLVIDTLYHGELQPNSLFPGQFRLGGSPFLHEPVPNRQQSGPDEHADEAKHQCATQYAKENQDEWQVTTLADEPWLDHIVHAADKHSPYEHENSPARRTLMEEPERGGNPDQRRTNRND